MAMLSAFPVVISGVLATCPEQLCEVEEPGIEPKTSDCKSGVLTVMTPCHRTSCVHIWSSTEKVSHGTSVK